MTQHRNLLSLLMLAVLFLGSCKHGENDPRIKVERIDGIEHVTSAGEPLRGRMPLEVVQLFRIDPDELKPDSPPLFDIAAKDDAGFKQVISLQPQALPGKPPSLGLPLPQINHFFAPSNSAG